MYVGSCLDCSGSSWTDFGGRGRWDSWIVRRVGSVSLILTATSFSWWISTAFWHSVTKGGSTYLSTCRVLFSKEIFFLSQEPVEIRVYLGASLCTYFFGSWCIIIGIIILGEVTFIVSYVFCFTAYWLIFMMLFIDICLYFVFCEIKNLFCLLVFSTHAFMYFV